MFSNWFGRDEYSEYYNEDGTLKEERVDEFKSRITEENSDEANAARRIRIKNDLIDSSNKSLARDRNDRKASQSLTADDVIEGEDY